MESRIIKRYTAYYHGWCLAFGEHQASFEENKDINWLFGDDRVGLVLATGLRKRMFRELLGHHEQIPELCLSENLVRINDFIYSLGEKEDSEMMRGLIRFLIQEKEPHLFLSSHFCYPSGTRIITFAKKKPLLVMYKEMQPLKVSLR